jgi:UDP-glucose 4-epimerase
LFNVYGTRSRTNSAYGAALGVFLKQKILNKPFTIVGNGNQKRDFIYVSDVCNAFYKALNKDLTNQKFNIGFGKPRKVNEMVKIIGGFKTYVPKRPGEPDLTHADISKAKKFLSWKPQVTLEKGLNKVIKNINYWKDAPLWTPKKIKLATKDWFKYIK